MLKCGIVGLPNVGKSTLFNALTNSKNAESANYPFCTIDPNVGVVTVPDERLDVLAKLVNAKATIPTTIEFVDIAGLVKGASRGEGLGNQFLANIRECDAIIQVVRCFDDPNTIHVEGKINPIDDIETINTELALADMSSLENRQKRILKQNPFFTPYLFWHYSTSHFEIQVFYIRFSKKKLFFFHTNKSLFDWCK